jgi:hypothetical protein
VSFDTKSYFIIGTLLTSIYIINYKPIWINFHVMKKSKLQRTDLGSNRKLVTLALEEKNFEIIKKNLD